MIKAVAADKGLVVDLLARSFQTNKSVNYILSAGDRRSKRLVALMEYSFEACLLSGDVWLSDDRKACALTYFPHLKKMSIRSVWLDGRLIFKAIGLAGIRKALRREAAVKKLQPPAAMLYLWFIGVDPAFQRQGIGSSLLTEVLAFADKSRLPVYLETSALENLSWYEHFGFVVYGRLVLTYTLFFLKRETNRE
ncbi:MAG: GCN5-related N-acetyltransferase [Mucilaginibacter sp.]|nr:GCN5-related N-acetyltransferase [Mucilaginibacter sp.]